ncbi:unnamed protein product [Nippostrongylus brasiliensis]|uniref:Transposase n=1 Tax=Nippostrongylus brasiliensis TaxID=27835 RepID=A0A0N4XXN8_NIPBR|nr:unnamed protein product [Nippostrongylus brasiliensis]
MQRAKGAVDEMNTHWESFGTARTIYSTMQRPARKANRIVALRNSDSGVRYPNGVAETCEGQSVVIEVIAMVSPKSKGMAGKGHAEVGYSHLPQNCPQ